MDETQVNIKSTGKSWLDKVSYAALLLVTFLSPIFFIPVSFLSTQFTTSLLFAFVVILSILAYIIGVLKRGYIELPKPSRYVMGFTAVVPLVYILSSISNGFSRMSLFGYTLDIYTVGFVTLAFAYLFLVSVFFRNKHKIFYSYFAFVISSLILSLFLLARIILGQDILSFGIFTGLTSTVVGSWNNVGIFFAIGVILSLLTYQMLNVSKLMKVLLTLALLFSLFFLALVNFGIIWVILGICSALFILYSLFNSHNIPFSGISLKKKLLKIPLYPLIVLVISVVFVVWGNTLGSYLANELNVSNIEVRPNLAVTMDIAKNTIMQKPVFGSGPNTFVTQWLSFKPDDVVTTIFWNTDFTNGIGLIPTFAITTGIAGILSWLLFLGFYVYLGIKSIFAKVEDSFIRYLLTSSFFVSLYLWIMAFVYVPSSVVFILTFFFTGLFFASVYLAEIIPFSHKVFSNSPKAGFLASLGLVTVFATSLFFGYGLFNNSKSLWYFQKSFYALNTANDADSSETYMTKAIEAVPHDLYFRALSEIELVKLNKIISQDPKLVGAAEIQKQFGNVLADAIKAGLAAKDSDPSNYLNWIALGRVYESVSNPQFQVQGSYESAKFAYGEALRRNPKNPGILILFARLEVMKQDLKQAKNYALQAITLKRNYLEAYFLLTQIEVADKNIKGAIESATAASIINPNDPGVFFQLGLLRYNSQQFTEAIQAFEKATTMTPDYANARYFLGLSYDAVGKNKEAIGEFEKLKITNPDNKDVETILNNLKAGKPGLADTKDAKPEKGKNLPVKETIE